MPLRDGSGPLGQGSLTGRGLGNCAPSESGNLKSSSLNTLSLFAGAAGLLGMMGRHFFGRRGANRLYRNRFFNNRRR